jgi:hypothetical protein
MPYVDANGKEVKVGSKFKPAVQGRNSRTPNNYDGVILRNKGNGLLTFKVENHFAFDVQGVKEGDDYKFKGIIVGGGRGSTRRKGKRSGRKRSGRKRSGRSTRSRK